MINCEYIGDKLIEVHLRHNEDFNDNITEFIPVWKGQDTTPPEDILIETIQMYMEEVEHL